MSSMYPWGGEFTIGNTESCVAAVTLSSEFALPKAKVAIYGPMKTENIGIEKVIANVISNPRIRFLLLCGEEVRGHRSGATLIALHANGLDDGNRVISAPGAVPYVENLERPAVERFRSQVQLIDMTGCTDKAALTARIDELLAKGPGPFGEPFIAERVVAAIRKGANLGDIVALHRTIALGPFGEVSDVQLRD
ncbi:MAG: tetrahydromethanopterin S-methyltransferase subunit A [Euryarchaeota archaeon]|nr:tetrahydromethanopterin S-methyltransferase subunit A [Euryarchaeota archaeon]